MQSIAQTMERIAVPEPPSTLGERLKWGLSDGMTIARRNLSHIRRVPERLMNVTVQPIVFVVLLATCSAARSRCPEPATASSSCRACSR